MWSRNGKDGNWRKLATPFTPILFSHPIPSYIPSFSLSLVQFVECIIYTLYAKYGSINMILLLILTMWIHDKEQWSFMGKGYCERVPGRKQLSRNAKTVTECKTLCENDRHRTCKFISYQFMKMNGRNYCYGYPKCHTQLNYRDDYESYSMGPNTG